MPTSTTTESASVTSAAASTHSSSLLRRFKSRTASALPFRTPRRSLTDFHVALEDPHRAYSPSDIITGSVCVTVEKPLPLTHITVCLVGCVDVYSSARQYAAVRKQGKDEWKDPWESGGGGGGVGGKTTAAIGGDYNGIAFCRDEVVLSGQGRLEPGIYRFGFELEFCKLPIGGGDGSGSIPTSIDFERGSISYNVVATITRPTNITPISSCSARVLCVEHIDIADLPAPKPRLIELEPLRHHHRTSKTYPARPTSPTSYTSTPSSSTGHLPDTVKSAKHPITATVELLAAGALRGGNISVRISIQHTKFLRSMHGVIVTLMRQTRFDSFSVDDDIKPSKNNPAPSSFRKDLAQTICPLITDHQSLAAEIKATLRVPDDAFPTTKNVPGGAVEFRYFIEVMLDLRGKLKDHADLFSSSLLETNSEGIIETERIRRREKSIIACKFELIIGSANRPKRARRDPPPVLQLSTPTPTIQEQQEQEYSYLPPPAEESQYATTTTEQELYPHYPEPYFPPPPPDEHVDEKTAHRLAAEALLPSTPPGDPGPSVLPSLPAHGDYGEGEDKQEVERRRLLEMESEPPGELPAYQR